MSDVPEMVERVAKAMCSAQGLRWEDQGDPLRSGAGDDDTEYYYTAARSAIAAMREPTESMTKAGVDFALGVTLSGDYRWSDYIRDMHRRQIDAALTPPKHPGS